MTKQELISSPAQAKKPRPLSPQQEEFTRQFVICRGNAAAAARAAGYSENAAKEQGHHLLTNPHIIDEIGRRMKRHFDRLEVTEQKIMNELARIAFSDLADYVEVEGDEVTIKNWDDLPQGMTRALQELSVGADGKIKVKTHGVVLNDPLAARGEMSQIFALVRS